MSYGWSRVGGYDIREFRPALNDSTAKLFDGRSIEEHFKEVKRNATTEKFLYSKYFQLWRSWADLNSKTMEQFQYEVEGWPSRILTDSLADSTGINPARALADLLNEKHY